jgi:phage shock protein C
MAEKTRPTDYSSESESVFDVSSRDLESTLQQYIEEDSAEVKKKDSLLNPITAIGLGVLAVCALSVIQVFLPFESDFSDMLTFISIFGSLLVLLIGLGTFSRPKRKKKKTPKMSSTSDSQLDEYGLQKKKRLFKSRTNRKISGVCGGLADYIGMDPTIVRILFIVFTFIGSGSPVLAYIVLSMILPKEPKQLGP